MSWYIHCDTSYSKNKLAANMKGFDYSLQFIHCRESWKWISTEVNDPYPNEQLLHVIAEEKSAVELRYLCCINFHLFYKRKRVTNPDIILYVLTTDSTQLVCKDPGKLKLLFNQNLLLLHCLHIVIPADTTKLLFVCIQWEESSAAEIPNTGIGVMSLHALWQPLKVLQLQEVKLLGSLHHSEPIHSN